MNRRFFLAASAIAVLPAFQSHAQGTMPRVTFDSAYGGIIDSADWAGRPVLVVNAASRCGFAHQYDRMQDIHEAYEERGLIVLAIPSDDFKQELSSIEEVKDFCEMNFGLTLPMTDITHVRGTDAHPLYQWFREERGFVPRWNFNKVLIGADGQIKGTWESSVEPDDRRILDLVEAELGS